MTTPTTGSPATHSDSTPERRCALYHHEYRLPAVVDPASRRTLLPVGGLVEALTMPDELGQWVLAGLRVRMLAGPVVEHPHGRRWTFLTGPGHPPTNSVHADLLRLRASVACSGDDVILPSPDDEHLGLWHWVRSPEALDDLPARAVRGHRHHQGHVDTDHLVTRPRRTGTTHERTDRR